MADPFDYLESRDDADELIQEFGRTVALRRIEKSGPVTHPTETPHDYSTFAARVEFTWRQLQGGDILATDQRWLVAAGPLAASITDILPADALVIDGTAIPIYKATPLNPAGTVVLFDCQLRL